MPLFMAQLKGRLLLLTLALAAQGATGPAHAENTLDRIKTRGKAVIGVLVAGGHFGSIDASTGELKGFNPALARAIAEKLGAQAELVQVVSSNRIQFLQQGRVDMLVADMDWTAERAQQLTFVPTPYYRTGGALLARKDSGITKWEDLHGQSVCVSQGSNYNKPLTETYGAVTKGFRSGSESRLALRGGNCVAAVHDGNDVYRLIDEVDDWKDYTSPLPELIPSPTVVWLRQGETATAKAVDEAVRALHQSGWIIKSEMDSGVTRANPALQELRDTLNQNKPLPHWAQR
ncbi:transporter substrate-binding domain-containing protein [Achromobacter marplatensis]|uniref:transporter substrate-binding domain-containing protein n=1 Tax=Achromobacter marplatensis TaxID=470868 RepID=UPI0028E3BF1B|nr:transporter substrate-binding domain-containing protein [Achromobacter marplatensis]